MFLKDLEIKNYRSLEDVKINNLRNFNVLIGRNNAGKSSVFLALSQLGNAMQGRAMPHEVLIDLNQNKSIEIHLTFKLTNEERKSFVNLLVEAGIPIQKEAIIDTPFLRMMHFIFRSFLGRPDLIHIRESKIWAQDGKWATIHRMNSPEITSNPEHKFVNLPAEIIAAKGSLNSHVLDLNIHNSSVSTVLDIYSLHQFVDTDHQDNKLPNDNILKWIYKHLYHYFFSAYFFNPFRHGEAILPVQLTTTLAQNGSNLAQVLHSLIANDREAFDEIEKFIHGALPETGRLQTPLLQNNQTQVTFRPSQGRDHIALTNMGGGIEQLLMVAIVLLTTSDENPIFLEEPESHLHAGAQRYLIERLYSERQVFIATHSSTFINLTKPFSLYQVLYKQGRTNIVTCDPKSLETVLEDIDIRNSDVLFSDAVLFIEGPGDRDVITLFSEKLNMNIAERNITVLPMGGGKHVERGAPIRSDLLKTISRKATVPHLFLIDRDERSKAEIHNLETQLGDAIHILHSRELENYLLKPRAILAALKEKHRSDQGKLEQLAERTEEYIQQLIVSTAKDLYGLVLLKRIQCEIGGLKEGLLPKEAVITLSSHVTDLDLPTLILQEIKKYFEGHVAGLQLDAIVASEKEALDVAWADPTNHLQLAPGEEILDVVFSKLGSEYRKPKDTIRIAKEMRPDEIDTEIRDILTKTHQLSPYYQ